MEKAGRGIVGAVVGIASGNIRLGFLAYNTFYAAADGGNIGAAVAGDLAGYLGGALVGNAFGNFWGTVAGGAIGGAAGAGVGGGNVGLAALAGLGSSWTGYATGAFTKLAGLGTIVGGGVGAEISGGDFGEGALGGVAYNIGFTIGSSYATMPSAQETSDAAQYGDTLFYAGDRIWSTLHPLNILQAILSPGPFNHTNTSKGNGQTLGSHPGMGTSNDGPDTRTINSFDAFKDEKIVRIRGNSSIGKAAEALVSDMQQRGVAFRYLSKDSIFSNSSNAVYCSQFTSQVYGNAGVKGIYGFGPNSQYWYLKR